MDGGFKVMDMWDNEYDDDKWAKIDAIAVVLNRINVISLIFYIVITVITIIVAIVVAAKAIA